MITLRPEFAAALPPGVDPFDYIMGLDGEVYREMNGRRTLRFRLGERWYFLKAHMGVGWKDILEDLLYLRRPVIGVGNEWRGIRRLEELEVATMKLVGFGQRGWNPARLRSFVVTEALTGTVSLEEYCRRWRHRCGAAKVDVGFKRALIRQVAQIARRLHQNGVNHRDFYLCHFLLDCTGAPGADPGLATVPSPLLESPLPGCDRGRAGRGTNKRVADEPPRLFLIDLHRMQVRRRTPRRWILKDVGGLYFSSMDIGLTQRDLFRFMRWYRDEPLREVLQERTFWGAVRRRALRTYRSEYGRDSVPVH